MTPIPLPPRTSQTPPAFRKVRNSKCEKIKAILFSFPVFVCETLPIKFTALLCFWIYLVHTDCQSPPILVQNQDLSRKLKQ